MAVLNDRASDESLRMLLCNKRALVRIFRKSMNVRPTRASGSRRLRGKRHPDKAWATKQRVATHHSRLEQK